MPRKATIPNLEISTAQSRARPRLTKATGRRSKAGGSKPRTSSSTMNRKPLVVIGAILLFGGAVTGLVFLIIHLLKDDKKLKIRSTDAIDRHKDREDPEITVAPVDDELDEHTDVSAADVSAADADAANADAANADAANADAADAGAADPADADFRVQNKEEFDKQFQAAAVNSVQKEKVLASQLGRESVLPEFSVDRQPARQVGMSLDMVYKDLLGDGARPRQFGAAIPFGGSEFQEMQRARSQQALTAH